MTIARIGIALALIAGLAACAGKFETYNGPQVTQLQIYKSQRLLYLLHGNEVLKAYRISLGGDPVGPKQVEGDEKTPEGLYYIDRRNPESAFYLSLGISYPNRHDVQVARALGESPGGDIFIHGQRGRRTDKRDWTAGCIAIPNKDMRAVYAMVRNGTPIFILP
jgi:murein L,D-transpeptidase YafK